METNYKVVKLTNGDNIICETVEHVNETYIIRTPLKWKWYMMMILWSYRIFTSFCLDITLYRRQTF